MVDDVPADDRAVLLVTVLGADDEDLSGGVGVAFFVCHDIPTANRGSNDNLLDNGIASGGTARAWRGKYKQHREEAEKRTG